MGEHALLSASGSKRWLSCPPSARLEEKYPDSQSEYAAEGSLAHLICELKLRKTFEIMPKSTFSGRLKKLKASPLYQEEMMEYTDAYHDYIHAIMIQHPKKPAIAIEKRLDYSHIAPEGFGTGDCIIRAGSTLYVIDFKYGKGVPVNAEENTQMLLYALGALKEYEMTNAFTTVKLVVFQPRLDDGISEWECPVEGLVAWGESIKHIAQLAFDGGGQFCAGDHCKFCRAKSTCCARANNYLALEEYNKAVSPALSNDQIGEILVRAKGLADWAKDLEEYALAEVLKGGLIKGWKAVEGRSNRKITDVEMAYKVLIGNGFEEDKLFVRSPIGLTAVEELVGKKKFSGLCGEWIVKPEGKPTLVEENDKRPAFIKNDVNKEFDIIGI